MVITSGQFNIAKIIFTVSTIFIIIATDKITLADEIIQHTDATQSESSIVEEINTEMYVTDYCNVYKNPDNTSEKICAISKGEKLKVLSKLSNNWYKVETSNTIGYIKSDYLSSTSEVFIDTYGITITSVKPDGTIKYNNDISNTIVNYAYNYWYLLPENIRNNFTNNEWHIELVSTSLKEEYNLEYTISGITLPEEHTIKLQANQSSIRNALIHEIGHYLDYINNYPSSDQAFKSLYNKHGSKLLDTLTNFTDSNYNEKEYFAELFKAYILNDYTITYQFSSEINIIKTLIGNSWI